MVFQNNAKNLMEDRLTNEEVYRRMITPTYLLIEIIHKQLSFLGHVIRKYELKGLVVIEFVDGKRARARPNTPYILQQDDEQVAIGNDADKEVERSLVEMVYRQPSTSWDMILNDDLITIKSFT